MFRKTVRFAVILTVFCGGVGIPGGGGGFAVSEQCCFCKGKAIYRNKRTGELLCKDCARDFIMLYGLNPRHLRLLRREELELHHEVVTKRLVRCRL